MNLTPRQADVLKFIRAFRAEKGYAPTQQEIGEELGVSKVTAHEHMKALARKGAVIIGKHKCRDISLADDPHVAMRAMVQVIARDIRRAGYVNWAAALEAAIR